MKYPIDEDSSGSIELYVSFFNARCKFKNRDYDTASALFDDFRRKFGRSAFIEDAEGMVCRLDNNTVLEKGLYYYQGNDFASELVYSISRLCEPCLEHTDNNFNPLDAIQKGEFSDVAEDITYLIQQCRKKMENNEYNNLEEEIRRANDLNGQLSLLKRKELQRIQSQSGSIRVSMVYLTMVQEAQNVVTYTINLMKVSRKFQMETEMP